MGGSSFTVMEYFCLLPGCSVDIAIHQSHRTDLIIRQEDIEDLETPQPRTHTLIDIEQHGRKISTLNI